ncbi:hypothetical protein Ndes2526B_g08591 [Nannochloris sp. 'desiccata']
MRDIPNSILLLAMFSLALSQPALGQEQNTTAASFTVCTLNRPPMSFCNVINPPEEYTGLSIETFRAAGSLLGWNEGIEYQFECKTASTGELMAELAAGIGPCDAAVASITISTERQEQGILFAYPYYQTSIGIMVKSDVAVASGWSFFEPFSTDLWIAIAVTMFAWPASILAIEVFSLRSKVNYKEMYYGLEEATWRSLWALQHGGTFEVTSLGARIAAICFSFFALILCPSYTANLAAFLTVQRSNMIRSVYDLSGLAVSSVPVFIPRLKLQYGIFASDANISDVEGVVEEAELVAKGALAAFMYDNVVEEYVAATFPGCAVRVLPDKVQPFDYGVAFKKGTDPELVSNFSIAILEVQEAGLVSEYEEKFLLKNGPCSSANADGVDHDRISFNSVYGLWVILCAGLVAGVIVMVFVRRHRVKAWEAHKKEMAGLPNGVAPDKRQKHNAFVRTKSSLEDMSSDLIDTIDEHAGTTRS